MRIIVATLEENPPAARALRMEGLDVEESVHTDRTKSYGALFSELWDTGRPFVLVEHDVIPAPGSVQALIDCEHPYCSHRFPNGGTLLLSFGIGKYKPDGPSPSIWRETDARLLDGAVIPEVRKRLGPPHVHEPPCAHAREHTTGAIGSVP